MDVRDLRGRSLPIKRTAGYWRTILLFKERGPISELVDIVLWYTCICKKTCVCSKNLKWIG